MASIFDDKKDEIIRMISEGYNNREIFDKLYISEDACGYSFASLRSYIKQRGYRLNIPLLDCLPKCKECDECVKIEPFTKINGTLMYCSKTMKQVRPDIKHSPDWCHRRKEILRKNMEGVEELID